MSIVANTTTHPALVLRNAVDTITTELVRAPITPKYLTVGNYTHGTKVDVHFDTREDFDVAVALFGLGDLWEYGGDEEDSPRRIVGSAKFMGVHVTMSAPAFPAVVADCDSVAFN